MDTLERIKAFIEAHGFEAWIDRAKGVVLARSSFTDISGQWGLQTDEITTAAEALAWLGY